MKPDYATPDALHLLKSAGFRIWNRGQGMNFISQFGWAGLGRVEAPERSPRRHRGVIFPSVVRLLEFHTVSHGEISTVAAILRAHAWDRRQAREHGAFPWTCPGGCGSRKNRFPASVCVECGARRFERGS